MARHPRCLGASPLAPLAGTGRDPGAVPTGHRVVDGLTKHAHLVSSDELAASWVRGDTERVAGAHGLDRHGDEGGTFRWPPREIS